MVRALLLILVFAAPAFADPATDGEAARLQAAEAAVRAGVTAPRPVLRAPQAAMPVATMPDGTTKPATRGADGYFPLRQSAAREFPLPPRNESLPTAGGVQALVAAGKSTPVAKENEKTAREARDTADGLQAIQDFRHNHGLQ